MEDREAMLKEIQGILDNSSLSDADRSMWMDALRAGSENTVEMCLALLRETTADLDRVTDLLRSKVALKFGQETKENVLKQEEEYLKGLTEE